MAATVVTRPQHRYRAHSESSIARSTPILTVAAMASTHVHAASAVRGMACGSRRSIEVCAIIVLFLESELCVIAGTAIIAIGSDDM